MTSPISCENIFSPPCDVSVTSSTTTYNPIELPVSAFPPLAPPEGGLRSCNEIIPNEFPDSIIPKEVVLQILQGIMTQSNLAELAEQMPSVALYDVRAHKVCTTCQDINTLWETNNACSEDPEVPCTSKSFASEVMPYCIEGSFAHGRTMSGLLLEPIDSTTKEPIVGRVASTIYSYPTPPDPFTAPTVEWPSTVSTDPPFGLYGSLAAASAGTYTIIPDVLGNGEDWEGVRSYIVKTVYQASAVPLLLKVKDDIDKSYNCTEIDERIALMGFSEGGYATAAIASAIDLLNDGYEHTYVGIGGAPIRLASEQLQAVGKPEM